MLRNPTGGLRESPASPGEQELGVGFGKCAECSLTPDAISGAHTPNPLRNNDEKVACEF